jgi:hypothetical protein
VKNEILSVVRTAMAIAQDLAHRKGEVVRADACRIVLQGLTEPFKVPLYGSHAWSDAECQLHSEASRLGRALDANAQKPDSNPVPAFKELFRDTVGTTDPGQLIGMVDRLGLDAVSILKNYHVHSFEFEVNYPKAARLKVNIYLYDNGQARWRLVYPSGADYRGGTADAVLRAKAWMAQVR